MKQFAFLALLFFSLLGFSQENHPDVSLIEKEDGKRLSLYAKNTGDIPYDVFLMIDTEDFRRQSLRPVIKTVNPGEEVFMLLMIKLTGKEGNYTKTFIVNEVAQDISMRKDHQDFDKKVTLDLKSKTVALFTKPNCKLCDEFKTTLADNYIEYQEFNIDQDPVALNMLIEHYKITPDNAMKNIPIIKAGDSLYTNLKTKEALISTLRKHL